MTYKEIYPLIRNLHEKVNNYVIERDEINNVYYQAKMFIDRLDQKAYEDQVVLDQFGKWLKKGSTIRLKELVKLVGYDDNNLVHQNAFCLIDSASIN